MTLKNHMNKALISLRPQVDGFVVLYCYDCALGRSLMSFLINKESLLKVATGKSDSMVDSDIDNHIHVYRSPRGDVLRFTVYYVRNEKQNGTYDGVIEKFELNVKDLLKVLVCGNVLIKVVYKNQGSKHSRLELSFNAHRAIAKMDKIQRRAFSKAMRDYFYYGDSNVFLTTDFDNGFYFTQEDSFSGGLVRNVTTVLGKDKKKYTCYSYSIHT